MMAVALVLTRSLSSTPARSAPIILSAALGLTVTATVPEAAPLRITELPYFVHEHDEIPARLIADNDKVESLSQCNACHRGAERGQFDEDDVVIPGFGRWDD